MKHRNWIVLMVAGLLLGAFAYAAEEKEEGFTQLFDGKTFKGWKATKENPDAFSIKDGALVTNGNRSHLFYVGDEKPFKNFHLKVDVMTEKGANGGIYFHTHYQEKDWPKYGFECQVNQSHGDWKKSGSLYDVVNVKKNFAKDNEWYTQEIIVQGNHVVTKINGQMVVDYKEPAGTRPGKQFTRKLDEGTFALQSHPGTKVYYKNIRVKRLPD